jgi:hypothetical protein
VQAQVGERSCFTSHAIDIGPIKKLGAPLGRTHQHLWPLYSLAYHTYANKADLVLIDGRFRVACALATWLDASPNTTVLIHDYHRRSYHNAELFFDIVERVEGLVMLRPNAEKKASSAWRLKAMDMYQSFMYDTA